MSSGLEYDLDCKSTHVPSYASRRFVSLPLLKQDSQSNLGTFLERIGEKTATLHFDNS